MERAIDIITAEIEELWKSDIATAEEAVSELERLERLMRSRREVITSCIERTRDASVDPLDQLNGRVSLAMAVGGAGDIAADMQSTTLALTLRLKESNAKKWALAQAANTSRHGL